MASGRTTKRRPAVGVERAFNIRAYLKPWVHARNNEANLPLCGTRGRTYSPTLEAVTCPLCTEIVAKRKAVPA
jgi:hypothetical protein